MSFMASSSMRGKDSDGEGELDEDTGNNRLWRSQSNNVGKEINGRLLRSVDLTSSTDTDKSLKYNVAWQNSSEAASCNVCSLRFSFLRRYVTHYVYTCIYAKYNCTFL